MRQLMIFVVFVSCITLGCADVSQHRQDIVTSYSNGVIGVSSKTTATKVVIWPDYYKGMAVSSQSQILLMKDNEEGAIEASLLEGEDVSQMWVSPTGEISVSQNSNGLFCLSSLEAQVSSGGIDRGVISTDNTKSGKDFSAFKTLDAKNRIKLVGATFRADKLVNFVNGQYVWAELWRSPTEPQAFDYGDFVIYEKSITENGFSVGNTDFDAGYILHSSWGNPLDLESVIIEFMDGWDSVQVAQVIGAVEHIGIGTLFVFFRHENGVAVAVFDIEELITFGQSPPEGMTW